jgi:hypothetical protein
MTMLYQNNIKICHMVKIDEMFIKIPENVLQLEVSSTANAISSSMAC